MDPPDCRHCLNCRQPLPEPRPRYCGACGQETNIKPPTLMEFAQQFGGAYLSTEGALWRTLALLLLRPGELTRQYLAGRRRHYVLPLRLYLTLSVIVLLLLRASTNVVFETQPMVVADGAPTEFKIDIGGGSAGVRDGRFHCEQLPAWVCQRLKRRLDHDLPGLQREVAGIGQRVMGNLGAAMFILLPAFALVLQLVYWNRRLRYTEHLVFALHVHAFWFVMLGLTLAGQGWLAALAFAAVPVYTLLAMRRVYGGRWWPRLARAALVSTVYGLTLAFTLLGLGAWALLF